MNRPAILLTGILTGFAHTAFADVNVVTSIKPVHSLVSAVMEGVGSPELLVDGASSPHGYSLKPSQAHLLEHADIVFWIGPDLEQFLVKPLASISRDADTVALEDAPGIVLHEPREGGAFEAHGHDHDHADDEHVEEDDDHDAHDHDAHDDDAHDDDAHDDESHDSHEAHEEHDDHDDHAEHGEHDPHIWLDPVNAVAMARQIAATLSEDDPANAATYQANLAQLEERLDSLVASVQEQLAPLSDRQFIAFHDAYRYFEERFGIHAAGSITIHPDVAPGAERITQIRERIGELDAVCVFAEPQFPPAMVRVVTEGTSVQTAVLDPLGTNIDNGPELYIQMIGGLADSVAECLSSKPGQ